VKPKNTVCLWFDRDAHGAAPFYAATFPGDKFKHFPEMTKPIHAASDHAALFVDLEV
jgi:predicted 3-demethylubiquinone-9 3-methyltransferase (glyoxalase superfamily)